MAFAPLVRASRMRRWRRARRRARPPPGAPSAAGIVRRSRLRAADYAARPSGDATTRASVESSPFVRRQSRRAESGIRRRAPPRRPLGLRAQRGVAVVEPLTRRRGVARRRSRISIATMPWPGAGTQTSSGIAAEMRAREPEPLRPAAASTSASYSPSSSLRRRVSTLPRIGMKRAPAEAAASAARCAARCRCRSTASRRGVPARLSLKSTTAVPRRSTSASRGSSRGSTAAIVEPVGQTAGMSLRCGRRGRSRRAGARPRFP